MGIEVAGERIELLLPVLAVLLHVPHRFTQWAGEQVAPVLATFPDPANDTGPLEHVEMLADGGARHGKRFRQLTDVGIAAAQACQDRPPGRVGESSEEGIEAGWGHYTGNHMVTII